MRFRLRGAMIAVAVVAVLLGGMMEGSRVFRRWEYCREQAGIHAAEERTSLTSEQYLTNRTARLTALIQRYKDMGPEKKSIDDLIASSDDLAFTRWFFTPAKIQLLYDEARNPERPSDSRFSSAANVARFLEDNWEKPWREELSRRARWAAYHARMKQEYLHAASRPWLPLPVRSPPGS